MGLFRAYAGLGADRSATTNPAGFVRIPGHANKKYLDRTSVEAVHKSESVTTLTDIHQTLIDAELIRPPIVRRNSISEDIAILEAGVPEGVRNHACFTLALHYKEQGIPERDALTRLLFWNDGLITPDYPSRVKASVRSAYHNDYKPSRAHLGRIADRARACQSKPVSASTKAPKSPRDKIREYAARIRRIIESCGGYMVISQRELSRSLNIPFRSFSHALELIPNLVVESYGKGRNATTTFRIDEHKPTLRLLSQESMPSLGEINDANK
jgi:hypothetical protein